MIVSLLSVKPRLAHTDTHRAKQVLKRSESGLIPYRGNGENCSKPASVCFSEGSSCYSATELFPCESMSFMLLDNADVINRSPESQGFIF